MRTVWIIGACLGFVLATSSGCVRRSTARREAQVAFLNGQQNSVERQERLLATTLMVRGQVRSPIVTWRPDMTLSAALLEAGYLGRTDPHRITLTREGVRHSIDVRRLLKGLEDPAVLPGDLVELY